MSETHTNHNKRSMHPRRTLFVLCPRDPGIIRKTKFF